jgi:hypothetical protein
MAGDWGGIALEWVRMGAVSPAVHAGLQTRFMRFWANRPQVISKPPVFKTDRAAKPDADVRRVGRFGASRDRGRDGTKPVSSR